MSEKPNAPLRSEYAGDPDMADLVRLFVEELPKRVEALESAYGSGEAEVMRRLAHQMKGAAGGYGFPSISQAAGKLETAMKAMGNPSEELSSVGATLRELLDLCARASEN